MECQQTAAVNLNGDLNHRELLVCHDMKLLLDADECQ
jgi:hypothetical protein